MQCMEAVRESEFQCPGLVQCQPLTRRYDHSIDNINELLTHLAFVPYIPSCTKSVWIHVCHDVLDINQCAQHLDGT